MPEKSTLQPQTGWTCLVEGVIQFHERPRFCTQMLGSSCAEKALDWLWQWSMWMMLCSSARKKNLSKRRKLSLWLNGNAEILEMLRNSCACTSRALDLVSPLISATTLRKSWLDFSWLTQRQQSLHSRPTENLRQIQGRQWQLILLTTNPLLEAYCI